MNSAYRAGPTPRLSRRNMLLGAATVGVAGAAVSVAGLSEAFEEQSEESADTEPIVVHVHDLKSGRLDVFAGDRRIEVRDRDLAARLARAARRG